MAVNDPYTTIATPAGPVWQPIPVIERPAYQTREQIALVMMHALVAGRHNAFGATDVARLAYEYADALLAQRDDHK